MNLSHFLHQISISLNVEKKIITKILKYNNLAFQTLQNQTLQNQIPHFISYVS